MGWGGVGWVRGGVGKIKRSGCVQRSVGSMGDTRYRPSRLYSALPPSSPCSRRRQQWPSWDRRQAALPPGTTAHSRSGRAQGSSSSSGRAARPQSWRRRAPLAAALLSAPKGEGQGLRQQAAAVAAGLPPTLGANGQRRRQVEASSGVWRQRRSSWRRRVRTVTLPASRKQHSEQSLLLPPEAPSAHGSPALSIGVDRSPVVRRTRGAGKETKGREKGSSVALGSSPR